MSLINRDADYAICAISWIAKQGNKKEVISAGAIHKNLKISKPFLRKILQILVKNKILKSVKGRKGGFKLALFSEKIFLMRIIETFQGRLEISKCFLDTDVCPRIKNCKLRRKLHRIKRYIQGQLEAITIKDLL
ncbi:MAG: Rrf2 family transcriptional regulator [Candidatus Omnitrophica bacterium]|nr:Rrf2 family transcriptional regulator [Candidatus Omnitrophota bacterium]